MAICNQFRFRSPFHHNVPKQYRQLLVLFLQGPYAIQTSTDVTFQSTDICQTTTRFDPLLWSPAGQLYFVFSITLRGCRHQIIKDVQVTQVTVCIQFLLRVFCRTQYRIGIRTRTPPWFHQFPYHQVLKFWSILTKLSPSIRCDVPSGGCCRFTAGLQVDRLKQARGSVSGTPVKLLFTWLFFCTSINRDTFFIGISRIFLSGT